MKDEVCAAKQTSGVNNTVGDLVTARVCVILCNVDFISAVSQKDFSLPSGNLPQMRKVFSPLLVLLDKGRKIVVSYNLEV